MATLFLILTISSLVALTAALIRPSFVIRWGGEQLKTRKKAGLIFGISFLLFFIFFVFTVPEKEKISETKDNQPKVTQDTSSALPQETQQPTQQEPPTPATEPKKTELETPPEAATLREEIYKVTYVVDGDTIELENGKRLRLIGIDTPENGQPYFTEARSKMIEFVLNKEVKLEKDISETDKYGRLLRYIYIGDTFINLEMVKQGYATAYTYPPDVKYSEQFVAAESVARNAKIGLWAPVSEPIPSSTPPVSSFSLPSCASTDCDCGDFSTHAYAQWFHDNYDSTDKHRLDGDKDGLVCESLP